VHVGAEGHEPHPESEDALAGVCARRADKPLTSVSCGRRRDLVRRFAGPAHRQSPEFTRTTFSVCTGGWIGVSACQEGGPVGKSNGRIGGFRLDQVARLSTIAA